MIQKLFNSFGTTIYVQIWENRIRAIDIKTGSVFDEKPLVAIETTPKGKKLISAIGDDSTSAAIKNNTVIVNPFSHPRVLFSDFQVGEKLLQHVIQTLLGKKLFSPSPIVVIHPMEKIEGGLTMIEKRAFRELALCGGAREVYIYQGSALTAHAFDLEAVRAVDSDIQNNWVADNKKTSPYQWVIFIVFAIIAAAVKYGS